MGWVLATFEWLKSDECKALTTFLTPWLALGGTLFALYRANKASDRRWIQQREHEIERSQRDLETNVRKDIFLEVAETYNLATQSIMRFQDLTIPADLIFESFAKKSASFSKAHLISGNEVIDSLLEFSRSLYFEAVNLHKIRAPLVVLHDSIVELEKSIKYHTDKANQFTELINNLSFSGDKDANHWTFSQNAFKSETENRSNAIKKCDELKNKINREKILLFHACSESLQRLQKHVPAIVRAMRSDLHLLDGFDYDKYESKLISIGEEVLKQSRLLIESFQESS